MTPSPPPQKKKKISTKSSYPKNNYFSENPKKLLKFKILNPKRMNQAYICMKISEYSPLGFKLTYKLLESWYLVLRYKLRPYRRYEMVLAYRRIPLKDNSYIHNNPETSMTLHINSIIKTNFLNFDLLI